MFCAFYLPDNANNREDATTDQKLKRIKETLKSNLVQRPYTHLSINYLRPAFSTATLRFPELLRRYSNSVSFSATFCPDNQGCSSVSTRFSDSEH